MPLTTDPNTRQAFITGLRDLADYLTATPPSPSPHTAPRSSCTPPAPMTADAPRSTTSPASSASASRTSLAYDGHYRAARSFGPVGYRMAAISDHAMARYHAPTPTTAASPPTPGPDA